MAKSNQGCILPEYLLEKMLLNLSLDEKVKALRYFDLIKELQLQVNVDDLTCAYNRKKFDLDLYHFFTYLRDDNSNLSLLMIDLDNFKSINDTYGHQAGDVVLQKTVEEIRCVLRGENESIYRYGGEEFAILIKDITSKNALSIANRLVNTVYTNVYTPDKKSISVSIGVASYDIHNPSSLEEMIEYADKGLYLAKKMGKNQVQVYNI